MSTTKLPLSASLFVLLVLCGCTGVSNALDEPPPTRAETKTDGTKTAAKATEAEAPGTDETGGADETKTSTGASRADAAACEGGVALDDGGLETGYGFVPSAAWGRYLQAYDAAAFKSRKLDTVCVCWLRTRDVDRVEFDVVFHRDAGGRPADEPYETRSAIAEAVPKGKEAGGRFYAVDVDGVEIPEGVSYIGVRFDPSAARYFFVCADQSPGTTPVPAFQQEDRAPALAPMIGSRDPLFARHGAMMLRAKAKPPTKPAGASDAGAADAATADADTAPPPSDARR